MRFLIGGRSFDSILRIGDDAPVLTDRTSHRAVRRSCERSFRTPAHHRERKTSDARLRFFDLHVVVSGLVIRGGAGTPLESQRAGVFHIAVDGFDGVPDTTLL